MENEVILKEGGKSFYIRVGNTVIDVMRGYNHSGDKEKEPVAIVNIYPFENKKENRVIVYEQSNKIVYNK